MRPEHLPTFPRSLHPGAWWLWAIGAGGGREPDPEPGAAAADRGGHRLRGRGPAQRRALGPLLRRVPEAVAGRDRGAHPVPVAALHRRAGPDGAVHAAVAAAAGGQRPQAGRGGEPRGGAPGVLRGPPAGHHPVLRRRRERAGQRPAAAAVRAGRALRDRRRLRDRADLRARSWSATPRGSGRRTGCAGRAAGSRSLKRLAMPVLEGALERSVDLAAAMDARGYGRTTDEGRVARRTTAVLVFGGLLGVCVGIYGLLDATASTWLGTPMLLVGLGRGGRRAAPGRPPLGAHDATGRTRGRCPSGWSPAPAWWPRSRSSSTCAAPGVVLPGQRHRPAAGAAAGHRRHPGRPAARGAGPAAARSPRAPAGAPARAPTGSRCRRDRAATRSG